MDAMENSIINALAFLRVSQNTNTNDYLDNFLPFVTRCLQNQEKIEIDQIDLQNRINQEFSIEIPLHVIKSLLIRAAKKNYVCRKSNNFYKITENLSKLNFNKANANVQRIYNALINSFKEFAQINNRLNLTDKEAERIIISFIAYNHTKMLKLSPNSHQIFTYQALNQKEKFIISEFFSNAIISNPILYSYMIVNALYLPDVFNVNKNFKGTKFYFDTTFIIFALGYNDDKLKVACKELLDLLYSYGAELYCFSHTIQEIEGILYACSTRLNQADETTFGRSIYFFLSHGYHQEDIFLLISQLNRNIESLRIKIVDKPDYNEHKYVISESELKEILTNNINARPEAIEKDVDSISAIYRIRREVLTSRIEDSKAVFVTTNTTLSNLVTEFHNQKYNSHSISPCITDYLLTTILWLKSPKKAPNLPMNRLIADCYAAVQPDDYFLEKWFIEIKKIEDDPLLSKGLSVDDYTFLRYSGVVQNVLMESTYGNPEVIDSRSILDILDKTKRKLLEESENRIDDLLKDQEIITKENVDLHYELQKMKGELSLKENEIDSRIRMRAQKFSKKCTLIIKVMLYIILSACTILTFPFEKFNITLNINLLPQPVLFYLSIFLLIFTIADKYFGWNLNKLLRNIELKIENKRHLYLKSLIS